MLNQQWHEPASRNSLLLDRPIAMSGYISPIKGQG